MGNREEVVYLALQVAVYDGPHLRCVERIDAARGVENQLAALAPAPRSVPLAKYVVERSVLGNLKHECDADTVSRGIGLRRIMVDAEQTRDHPLAVGEP